MSVLLSPFISKDKSNWKRMCASEKVLDYQNGRLTKKGYVIEDLDAVQISKQLKNNSIEHRILNSGLIGIE